MFGSPVAILWFGLKSRMIRPGGKHYQPRFNAVRPDIERNIRIIVMAFVAFFVYFESVPFAQDLIGFRTSDGPLRITKEVKYIERGGYHNWVEESVGFSDGGKSYYLWYPSKSLRVGGKYELSVLPRSRMILDYREFNQ